MDLSKEQQAIADSAEHSYRSSLNNKKNICANSEISHSSDSEAGGFTLQEVEHLATLVKNDLPTGGNAYQYWNKRLLDKLNKICLQKQKEAQNALHEMEQATNWTKALKSRP